MGENLTDWLGENPWAAWLTLSLVLGCAELLTLDLTLAMLAGGALAGALTALVLPGAWVIQILVAVIASVAMLFLLRPTLLRRVRSMPGYRSSLSKLVGSPGTVTAEVTGEGGEVKVEGQVWRARPVDPQMLLPPGASIEVYEVDGVTLVVYPRDGQLRLPS